MKRFFAVILAVILLSLTACTPDNIVTPTPQPDLENNGNEQTDAPVTDNQNGQTQTQKKEKNEGVLPTLDIDTLDFGGVKTAELKDKTISLYVGDGGFTAGALSQPQWLDKICEQYGVNIDYSICNDSILYYSQAIAQKSGKTLDLIYASLSDFAKTLSLTRSADEFIKNTETLPFSQRVYELTDNTLFSAKGEGKMLWYNTAIVKEPISDSWTVEEFKNIANGVKNEGFSVIEADYLVDFEGLISYNDSKINVFDEKTDVSFLVNENDEPVKFVKENVAFAYTNAPVKRNMTVSWAPMPKLTNEDTNKTALTGNALGLSKNIKEENIPTALTLAMLWSARYTESRQDSLLFDLGLSSASCEQYISLCEKEGTLLSPDKKLSELIAAGETDIAKQRAELINKRYAK